MMGSFQDSIEYWIAHDDSRRTHIDFGSKDPTAVRKDAILHLSEQLKVFLLRAVSIGAVCSRLCQGTAVAANLLSRQVTNIGFTSLDELLGIFVDLIEIVRGKEKIVLPIKSQPFYILFD